MSNESIPDPGVPPKLRVTTNRRRPKRTNETLQAYLLRLGFKFPLWVPCACGGHQCTVHKDPKTGEPLHVDECDCPPLSEMPKGLDPYSSGGLPQVTPNRATPNPPAAGHIFWQ